MSFLNAPVAVRGGCTCAGVFGADLLLQAACNDRGCVSFGCETLGLALKEAVWDPGLGMRLLLVQYQHFACQHRRTLLAKQSRMNFQMDVN